MIKKINYVLFVMVFTIMFSGCQKWESESTHDRPSKSNLTKWGGMLNPRLAEKGELLATNDTKPSSVSPEMALTKMLQSLSTAKTADGIPLNTIYTIKRVDDSIVNGEYVYTGICEFDSNERNGGAIASLEGIVTCAGVVDANDPHAKATIRTANAQGEPYKMQIHMDSLTNGLKDLKQLFKWVHNKGYSNIGSAILHEVTKPVFTFDENWNPKFHLTWLYYDAKGNFGNAYFPLAFIDLDANTGEIQGYSLDNPITTNINEGENIKENKDYSKNFAWKKQSEIPEYVEWVYSRYLFIQMATHAYYNIDNHGVYSTAGWLIPDGTTVDRNVNPVFKNAIVDISQSRDRKNLIMTMYMTSRSNDTGINYIVTMNSLTGKVVQHDGDGMSVKSSWMEAIVNAKILLGDYNPEDFTMHEMFSTKTWMGVLTRSISDNQGRFRVSVDEADDKIYSEKSLTYSTYEQTCFIDATADVSSSEIICEDFYVDALNKYRNHLYKKSNNRGISTVLNDTKLKGKITGISNYSNSVVFTLDSAPNKTFVAEPRSAFDLETGHAISSKIGENVYIVYGEQKNLDISPVRIFKKLKN